LLDLILAPDVELILANSTEDILLDLVIFGLGCYNRGWLRWCRSGRRDLYLSF
jgi:hypothetical protein